MNTANTAAPRLSLNGKPLTPGQKRRITRERNKRKAAEQAAQEAKQDAQS